MKHPLLHPLGFLLGAVSLVVACGGSTADSGAPGPAEDSGPTSFLADSGPAEDSSTVTPVTDSGHVEEPEASDPDTGPAESCSGHCTQNSDCTAVCTPPSGDVACCDTATTMCYVASGMCQSTSTTPDAAAPY